MTIISAKCNTRPLPLSCPIQKTQSCGNIWNTTAASATWTHSNKSDHHNPVTPTIQWPPQSSAVFGLQWSSRDWDRKPVDRSKLNSFISSALKADCSSFTLLILLHLHFLSLAMPGWQFYVFHSCLLWKHTKCINPFFVVVIFALCVKCGSLNFLLTAMVYGHSP